MPDNLQPRPSVMHLRLECKNAKGFDTPLFEHKTIPEDDATSYDNEDITVLPALRRSAFERQIQPLQKTPGQTALPAFHQIVYANFRRNQDHSLNVRHASVLVFNASVSTKEQA